MSEYLVDDVESVGFELLELVSIGKIVARGVRKVVNC